MTWQGADGCKSRSRPATAAWGRSNRAYLHEKAEKLLKYFGRLMAIEVAVDHLKHSWQVEILRLGRAQARFRRPRGGPDPGSGDGSVRPQDRAAAPPVQGTGPESQGRRAPRGDRRSRRPSFAEPPASASIPEAFGRSLARVVPASDRVERRVGAARAAAIRGPPSRCTALKSRVPARQWPVGPAALDGGPDEAFGFRGTRGDPRRPAGDRQGRGDPRDRRESAPGRPPRRGRPGERGPGDPRPRGTRLDRDRSGGGRAAHAAPDGQSPDRHRGPLAARGRFRRAGRRAGGHLLPADLAPQSARRPPPGAGEHLAAPEGRAVRQLPPPGEDPRAASSNCSRKPTRARLEPGRTARPCPRRTRLGRSDHAVGPARAGAAPGRVDSRRPPASRRGGVDGNQPRQTARDRRPPGPVVSCPGRPSRR